MKSIWKYLQEDILNNNNPTIIEVGVHWAEDTRRIMNLAQGKPEYFGFEPDPRNIAIIKKEKLPHPIKLIEAAVGAQAGHTMLHLCDGINNLSGTRMTGANSIRKPSELLLKRHPWITWLEPIQVKVVTLDDVVDAKKVDFIWADMQGAEYDMILGGKNTFKKTRYAYLEYSDDVIYEGQKSLNDYMALLNSFGRFKIVEKYKTDVLIGNMNLL